MYSRNQSVAAYRAIDVHGQVAAATPHRLVQLMLQHAIEQLGVAGGALERGAVAAKGVAITKVFGLIEELNGSLDMQRGGEIAAKLRELYDYMVHRLTEANLRNDAAKLQEVADLLREIKSGWDGIAGHA
jgi:flagellar secretion chaperone FliS